jgi:hypothetical protein
MTTFTALGDSITLGLGDPVPDGTAAGWRGWAVFLAEGLPGGQLHNLAATGAQAADVERTQLPRALVRTVTERAPDKHAAVAGAAAFVPAIELQLSRRVLHSQVVILRSRLAGPPR